MFRVPQILFRCVPFLLALVFFLPFATARAEQSAIEADVREPGVSTAHATFAILSGDTPDATVIRHSTRPDRHPPHHRFPPGKPPRPNMPPPLHHNWHNGGNPGWHNKWHDNWHDGWHGDWDNGWHNGWGNGGYRPAPPDSSLEFGIWGRW